MAVRSSFSTLILTGGAMPQSLCLVLVHIIFSTKNRQPFLTEKFRESVHAYMATIARKADGECYRVGGVADHVHLAVRLSKVERIADLIKELKVSTTLMVKENWPEQLGDFSWQRGYGAFSVGPSDLPALLRYIDNQEEHHKTRTFQDEFRAFLLKYGVAFDERYVWN